MQNLRVTLLQTHQLWENKEANLARFDALLEEAEETDLIVLPEMFHTGFSMNAVELAETTENSLALNWLKSKAAEKNCAIYTSYIAQENEQYFNRGIFMLPSGKFEIYDKRKLFSLAGENEVFTAGNKQVIVVYKGWKILLQICYDLRFPEISRNCLDSNHSPLYDVILYIANWPEKRITHWEALLTARAIENQCYVIGLNRIGKDGKNLEYSGNSSITNGLGNKIVTFIASEQSIKTVAIEKSNLEEIRAKLAFLIDSGC